jgi:hypothetical protein
MSLTYFKLGFLAPNKSYCEVLLKTLDIPVVAGKLRVYKTVQS